MTDTRHSKASRHANNDIAPRRTIEICFNKPLLLALPAQVVVLTSSTPRTTCQQGPCRIRETKTVNREWQQRASQRLSFFHLYLFPYDRDEQPTAAVRVVWLVAPRLRTTKSNDSLYQLTSSSRARGRHDSTIATFYDLEDVKSPPILFGRIYFWNYGSDDNRSEHIDSSSR